MAYFVFGLVLLTVVVIVLAEIYQDQDNPWDDSDGL